jgi:hypothetical protein
LCKPEGLYPPGIPTRSCCCENFAYLDALNSSDAQQSAVNGKLVVELGARLPFLRDG